MAEYIEKSKLYNKLAEAEEEARKTFLEALPGDPFADIYQAKMNERTALKHMVADEPAADVAPVVHGQWEDVFQDGACSWSGRCSACKVRNDIPHPLLAHYCPNCGAKMDGGKSNGKT